MPKIVTIAEMKTIEAASDRTGVSYAALMEAAGQAVAACLLDAWDAENVLVLCGSGNNGGDGLVAAYHLAQAGVSVTVYAAQALDETDSKVQRLRAQAVSLLDVDHDPTSQKLDEALRRASVLVDAVFGTGARLPLGGRAAQMLARVQDCTEVMPWVVAVDCPSGLNCDTGAVDALTLRADLTVTFAAAKRGQFLFPAADYIGTLAIAEIGVPDDLPELLALHTELGTAETVAAWLPARPRNAHKGTFGRALIVAGSSQYTGAALLAGEAAYRIGAGLVTLAVPESLHPILAAHLPEATWLLLPATNAAELVLAEASRAQALLVGPGLGLHKSTAELVRRLLLENALTMPLVVDADGLRLLVEAASTAEARVARMRALPPNSILTPHPGEMAALTGLDTATIQADRIGVAQKYAALWGQVVVLKGAFTIVAAPDGRTTVQPFATPALARAGSGDVLAGMAVGLLAQGVAPYEAAVAATYLHGLAGELALSTMGHAASVLAGDVLRHLAAALVDVQP